MAWQDKYREDPKWLAWYREEFDRSRIALFVDDPDDAFAAARYKMLFVKLPALEPRHREHLDAFVKMVFRNVLRDLRREYSGRPRAPAEMLRVGEPIPQIYFDHCFEKKPVDVIVDELRLPRLSVQEWVTWLKAYRKCPEPVRKTSISGADPDDPLRDREFATDDREDPSGDDAEREQMHGIAAWLFDPEALSPAPDEWLNDALLERIETMRRALALTDEDRTLLRLQFVEDLAPAAIGESIGLPVHTVRRRSKALLQRIRQVFTEHGPSL